MMYFRPSYSRSPIETLLDRWEAHTPPALLHSSPPDASSPDSDSGSGSATPPPPQPARPDPVHLVDFLDEDDLIPECRGDFPKLIDYLTQDNIIMELVLFTTTPGTPTSANHSDDRSPPSEEEVRRGLKFPYMASEVLAAEVPRITEALVHSVDAMDKFLAFSTACVHEPTQELVSGNPQSSLHVDPYLAVHFGKVLTTLLRVAHDETVAHLWRVAPAFLPSLLSNMAVTPMAELLVRIGEGPDTSPETQNYGSTPPTTPSPQTMAILAEFDLLDRVATYFEKQVALLATISESQQFIEGISNAINVILGITVRVMQMPLNKMQVPPPLNIYARPEIVGRILDASLEAARLGHSTSPLLLALHLCKDLITSQSNILPEILTPEEVADIARYVAPPENEQHDKPSTEPDADASSAQPRPDTVVQIVPTEELELHLTKRYPTLANILGAVAPSTAMTSSSTLLPVELVNTSGPISPPLGTARLKIAEFFVSCLRAGSPKALAELTNLRVPNTLLEMMIKYCWSSMLHSTVSSAVEDALRNGPAPVLDSWLTAGLVPVLITAWEKNDEKEKLDGVRVGYMGHVIHLSVSLRARLGSMTPEKKTEFATPEELTKFDRICTTQLEEATQLESRMLGGERPGLTPGAGIDDDLDEPTEVFSMEGIGDSLEQTVEVGQVADLRGPVGMSSIPGDGGGSSDPLILDEDDEVVPLDLGDEGKGPPPVVEISEGNSLTCATSPSPFTHVDEETDSSEGEGYEAFDPTDTPEKGYTKGSSSSVGGAGANGQFVDTTMTIDEDVESNSSDENSDDYEKFVSPGEAGNDVSAGAGS